VGIDVLELGGVDDGAVETDPQIAAAARGHDAAEAGAKAAGHARLQGQLRGCPFALAYRPDSLEHPRWAAGINDGVGIVMKLGLEQIRDEPVVAAGAVVSCHRGS